MVLDSHQITNRRRGGEAHLEPLVLDMYSSATRVKVMRMSAAAVTELSAIVNFYSTFSTRGYGSKYLYIPIALLAHSVQ